MERAPHLFEDAPERALLPPPAPFLPTSREEMEALGWDRCDVVLVSGDAYVDHPSFGAALVGRLLEAHGFRVGILPQPDWRSAAPFRALGRPRLFFGVTAGNMDSLVNHYTSERKRRSDDAYTAGGEAGKRPDRAVLVYSQRCREAEKGVPIVIGGIEASLRRIAHYDYWQDKVRRSVLLDAKADLLVYGNAERAIVAIAHHLASGAPVEELRAQRGIAFVRHGLPEGFAEIDSTEVDRPGPVEMPPDPYATEEQIRARDAARAGDHDTLVRIRRKALRMPRDRTVIRLPAYEQVREDPVLYAHASRVLHRESNPGNARALVQRHGDWDLWLNPPPIPLETDELDAVFELPYSRLPHPRYGGAKIPAHQMIRFSVNAIRGCFGGCTFCSITEHEGRIIQSRSEASVLREIEAIRDRTPGFTGVISDIGGPTANMYRLACKSEAIQDACRKPSCVYPGICENLSTDHAPLIRLYRKARALPGVKKVLIASGLRYDLAVESEDYVRELASHHVGGYLKVAPEHVAEGPLSKMMKPGVGTYDRFKELFDRYSKEAGKEQFLIPYFIAAHPGTRDEDMVELALWLKKNGYRVDQVQAFLPSPMATATAMYHTERDPLSALERDGGEGVWVAKGGRRRRLHKALLRYHDPEGWPQIREALKAMGRADLIGRGEGALVPWQQPPSRAGKGTKKRAGVAHTRRRRRGAGSGRGGPRPGDAFTQHSGLPPRHDGSGGATEGERQRRRRKRRRRSHVRGGKP